MCKNKEELNALVAKYRKLSALEKKVHAAREAIKDDIIDYANRKGEKGGKSGTTMIVIGDGYKVSVITMSNVVFDSEKLSELLGDKVSEYQKSSTYPKLDIR